MLRQQTKFVVPSKFYDDHVFCDNGETDVVVTQGKYQTVVLLDYVGVADLYSRAEYYAEFDGPDYTDNRGLVDSARRTLVSLKKQAAANNIDIQGCLEAWRKEQS